MRVISHWRLLWQVSTLRRAATDTFIGYVVILNCVRPLLFLVPSVSSPSAPSVSTPSAPSVPTPSTPSSSSVNAPSASAPSGPSGQSPSAATAPSASGPTSAAVTMPPNSSNGMPPTASSPGPTGTQYQIRYTLDLFRIPLETDYVGVTNLTDSFLNTYLVGKFQNASAKFVSANTTRDSTEYIDPNSYLGVSYTTTLKFDAASGLTPAELDAAVADAFAPSGGRPKYLQELASLPVSNLFQTTTNITYVPLVAKATTAAFQTMSATTWAGIGGAAAGILAVLAAGSAILRRRNDDDREDGHGLGKFVESGGDMTVAETYAGTSVDAESVRPGDRWIKRSKQSLPAYNLRSRSPTETFEDGNDSDGSGRQSVRLSARQLQTIDF
jgi:hypothetical protein